MLGHSQWPFRDFPVVHLGEGVCRSVEPLDANCIYGGGMHGAKIMEGVGVVDRTAYVWAFIGVVDCNITEVAWVGLKVKM